MLLLLLALGSLLEVEVGRTGLGTTCVVILSFGCLAPVHALGCALHSRFKSSHKPFEHFLCHRKAGAGSFTRLLKMCLVETPGRRGKVFIDCDDQRIFQVLRFQASGTTGRTFWKGSKHFLDQLCIELRACRAVNGAELAPIQRRSLRGGDLSAGYSPCDINGRLID